MGDCFFCRPNRKNRRPNRGERMGDRQIGARNRLYSPPTPLNFPKREFVEMSDCAMGIMLCLRGKWRVCQNEDVWAAGPARRCRPANSPLVSILTHLPPRGALPRMGVESAAVARPAMMWQMSPTRGDGLLPCEAGAFLLKGWFALAQCGANRCGAPVR